MIRLKGKKLMFENADFKQAMDVHLLRAYICLSNIDFQEVSSHSQQVVKFKMQELEVKLLKLIFVCLSLLGQSYLERLEREANVGNNIILGNCLKEIAMDAYLNDVHNNQVDPETGHLQRPMFLEYVKSFELLARMYHIDNYFAKRGLKSYPQLNEPTIDQQKEAYKKLMDFNIFQ